MVISRRTLLVAGAAFPVSAYGQCVTDAPEAASTNLALQSGNIAAAPWSPQGITAAQPTVTANNTTAPDGTTTAARIVYPAVSAANNASTVLQSMTVTAAIYSFSIFLRGNTGGEQLYLMATFDASVWYRVRVTLTTSWQRFTLTTGILSATGWAFFLGTDLRDTAQTSTPAQTIYAWGAQVEPGAFATSYIPTTTVPVGRAVGSPIMSPTLKCRR